jgi:hypothetical protein
MRQLHWVYGNDNLHVEELALPKCVESGNLSFNEAIIQRMPEKTRSR